MEKLELTTVPRNLYYVERDLVKRQADEIVRLRNLVKRFADALGHDETLQGGERVGLTDRSRIDGPALNAALIDAKAIGCKAEPVA